MVVVWGTHSIVRARPTQINGRLFGTSVHGHRCDHTSQLDDEIHETQPSSRRAHYDICPAVALHVKSDTNTMLECANKKIDPRGVDIRSS